MLSYLVLFAIIGYTIYLFVCVFTSVPFLIPMIVFFSFMLILFVLIIFEDCVVKKMTSRYQKAISNKDLDGVLKEKIKFYYSTEIKMKMIEYKAICNSLTGKYNEARDLFEKIPYSFLICNPELALQSIFYLMIISMVEKNDEQIKQLSSLYLKRRNTFKRYYKEKQLPFFDRRINNPNIMIKKAEILSSICDEKKDYGNQLLVLFTNYKDTKLYYDIQQINI